MSQVIVETELGKIKGVEKVSCLGDAYLAFYGLRYAAAPVGDRRFKDPKPPVAFSNEIYDATYERSGCFEFNAAAKGIVGSDDCLFLNIYTKNVKPKKLRPVMVYIHGGAFLSGSSSTDSYSPDFLLMADVIVVTVNYRLGAFGFLTLENPDLAVPGNAGLKDQNMALKYVKSYIEKFGGDSDNITLFGHSAGGGSVSWHCVAEASKSLFNRAIIMSGCVLNQWCLAARSDWAYRLAAKLGYDGDKANEHEILKFLQGLDGKRIVEGQMQQLTRPEEMRKVPFPFAPCIEPYKSAFTFNDALPIDLIETAWSNDVDVMVGGASFEGLMHLQYIREKPEILTNFKLQNVIPSEVELPSDNPHTNEFVENLKKIYYSSSLLSSATSYGLSQDEMAYCKIKTDQTFMHGLQRIVQGRMTYGATGRTYMYHFDVDSPTQNHYRIRRLGSNVRGVCHADEVSYLFKNVYGDVPQRDSMEFKSIQRFVSLLTSFATSGNPNDNVIDADMQNVDIKPVDTTSPPFVGLIIDGSALKCRNMPEFERLKIWDKLYRDTKTRLF